MPGPYSTPCLPDSHRKHRQLKTCRTCHQTRICGNITWTATFRQGEDSQSKQESCKDKGAWGIQKTYNAATAARGERRAGMAKQRKMYRTSSPPFPPLRLLRSLGFATETSRPLRPLWLKNAPCTPLFRQPSRELGVPCGPLSTQRPTRTGTFRRGNPSPRHGVGCEKIRQPR